MGEVQREAFRTLSGKGLIDLDELERGIVRPSAAGADIFVDRFLPLLGNDERRLAKFLAELFSQGDHEIAALRRSTGLRRASL
jgi:DNA-binding FadR family transcriptional regulator